MRTLAVYSQQSREPVPLLAKEKMSVDDALLAPK
jgi:hypothetical protein